LAIFFIYFPYFEQTFYWTFDMRLAAQRDPGNDGMSFSDAFLKRYEKASKIQKT